MTNKKKITFRNYSSNRQLSLSREYWSGHSQRGFLDQNEAISGFLLGSYSDDTYNNNGKKEGEGREERRKEHSMHTPMD